eukprot:gene13227-14585_t
MSEEVTIQCDASEKGLGAVLLQTGQPVAFASRPLAKTEQQCAQIEKEFLAIVFACTKFSQYITRHENITVESDHKPLQSIFKKSLHDAPSRLQRIILQLQRYSINVIYKPGKQMYIADHLSRAQLADQEISEEFQVFSHSLEQVDPLHDIKLSNDKLAMLQKTTEQDPILQTLKTTVLIGWPEQRDDVPISIRDYWNFREQWYFRVHNGILLKSQRIIIPKSLRPEVIKRLHSSHQGIESCLRKARDRVYWPFMNSDAKEAIIKCEICGEFPARNARMPMQSYPIPERPWSRAAADRFQLNDKQHIVLIDFYSHYIEVSPGLKDTTSTVIFKFLKQQFSRHGIPDVLVTNNVPQYISAEFVAFSREWKLMSHHHLHTPSPMVK